MGLTKQIAELHSEKAQIRNPIRKAASEKKGDLKKHSQNNFNRIGNNFRWHFDKGE